MSINSGSTPMSRQVDRTVRQNRAVAPMRSSLETVGANRLWMDMPVSITSVPAGRLRWTPPARISTQARSQGSSGNRHPLASSDPPSP